MQPNLLLRAQLCHHPSPLSLTQQGRKQARCEPPRPAPTPGSQDSEGMEEQKREKILELKKKEKLLQEKLLQKVEELKKICLREAVSGPWPCWLCVG